MLTEGHRKDWMIVSLILLSAFCTQALAGNSQEARASRTIRIASPRPPN